MISRVPRYQNDQVVGGFCDYLFKSSHIGEDLDGVDASLVRFFAPKKGTGKKYLKTLL